MYNPKKFEELIGLKGFSEKMLRNHFTLYEGYVKNTNSLLEFLDAKESGTPEYSELQRRFGWEWNGMRLHELYFENMTQGSSEFDSESELGKKIEKIYGSYENWKKNFSAVGAMRGIGWVVLYYDSVSEELFNAWVNEHSDGHFAGCAPILVMDVFEHAYMTDYEIKKTDYIESFMKVISWQVVSARFESSKK
jgi:superoxide dismutase, Fe-Mn family